MVANPNANPMKRTQFSAPGLWVLRALRLLGRALRCNLLLLKGVFRA